MGINCKPMNKMKVAFQRIDRVEGMEKKAVRKASKKDKKQVNYMKVQTSVNRVVFKDWILNDDIVEFMEQNHISQLSYQTTELLDIDEKRIVYSYLSSHQECLDDIEDSTYTPGYWYANQLYDEIKRLTKFVGGNKEDMTYEIVEPGYCWDIPYAHRIIRNVKDFHKWMLENGKNNI